MKTKMIALGAFALILGSLFTGCKKDLTTVSTPPLVIGTVVSDTILSGNIQGTLKSGKTYTMTGNVIIPRNDTLLIQAGVTLQVNRGLVLVVQGTLISLGTQAQPNWMKPIKNFVKTDQVGASIAADSAYVGYWAGIVCDTSCKLCDIKWTHIEYTGANTPTTVSVAGGVNQYGILFQNVKGYFIFEDSWMYGNVDDAIRISCGNFSVMRNTFEKMGFNGGDGVNVKGGGVGDFAYNLCVGNATNASKASNKGVPAGAPECNMTMYNNTYIHCGYRQSQPTGRGGCIDYEQGAEGQAFNNLIVNCRTGIRICNNPAANVFDMAYGYNYSYGDSLSLIEQIYPNTGTLTVTIPQSSDIPEFSTLIANVNYQRAFLYDTVGGGGNMVNVVMPYNTIESCSAFVGENNPLFKNFPLPVSGLHLLSDVSAVGTFDFHLTSGSPALGKGTTSLVTPLNKTSEITNSSFKANVTMPSEDMGCYPSSGLGNLH